MKSIYDNLSRRLHECPNTISNHEVWVLVRLQQAKIKQLQTQVEAMKLGERTTQAEHDLVVKQVNEIKQLRQFIRDDYDRYNSYHPYAHKLRKMFPWLGKLAEKKPDDDRLARLKRQAKKAALAKVS